MKRIFFTIFFILSLVFIPAFSFAVEWTPLVTETMFDGVRVDLLTAVGGVLSLTLVVVGVAVLIKIILP